MRFLPHFDLSGFLKDRPATIKEAQHILGRRNVIHHERVCNLYGISPPDQVIVPYTKKTLKALAQQNEQGHEHRLFYRTGLSPQELFKRFPEEFTSESRDLLDRKVVLKPLSEIMRSAYRAIDFTEQIKGYNLQKGLEFLDEQKDIQSPARTSTVVEALITFRRLTKKKYLLREWHYGGVKDGVTLLVSNSRMKKTESGPNGGIMLFAMRTRVVEEMGLPNVGLVMCRVPSPEFEDRRPS